MRKSIQQEIAEIAQIFENFSNELLSVTRPLFLFEYENGRYGAIYLRPNKRLAKIFSTDREVVAIVTNFPEQQQRTVQALKEQIAESQGRLENTLAIVVHADPDGNAKLKNWGREQGIAILPISARDSLNDVASFERDLLQDFFSNDPFDVTGPVSDDGRFFGRRTEALDIARQLRGGQIRSSLGIRKIGKTSILNRVLHEAKAADDCLCIMVDCSKDEVWGQDAAELLRSFAETVDVAHQRAPKYAEVVKTRNKNPDISEARRALVSSIDKCTGTVIIFFDEVDYITPGSPTAGDRWVRNFNAFWRNLRATVQECSRVNKKLSLFVSGVSSKWFREESVDGVENAVLAFIPEEYLSPLAPNASAAMIRSIAKVAGLSFEDSTAEWIGAACGNMPYWTRKACSYVHRHVDIRERPCLVPRETAERLVKEFVEVEGGAIAEVALNHLFKVHPEVYEPADRVARGEEIGNRDSLVATLRRYGVLAEKAGKPVLASIMIEEGIKLYNRKIAERSSSVNSSATDPIVASQAFNLSIDEWADELALINATRNKLERKMRGLALNFIKFSSLQSPGSTSPSGRIQKCVEKNRIDRLKHLPPDDLIEKLLWSELVRLVEIEWTLFGSVFSDLKVFKDHATVINERPDAHAKDVDGADLALYRKSLRWLEDAVQRVSS